MALYFETSVRYDKVCENGAIKKITERYLVDTITFSAAEEITIVKRTPYMSGEFVVKTARRTNIAEIFNQGNADRYYLVKVAFIIPNEATGAEKKSITQILVNANDFADAVEKFMDGMRNTMADFEIISVAETPILEVYTA